MIALRYAIDLGVKLFALGLFIRAALTWVRVKNSAKVANYLDRFYAPILAPLRKVIKPVQLSTTPPSALDLTPLLLLLLVWWFIHPFLMWILT